MRAWTQLLPHLLQTGPRHARTVPETTFFFQVSSGLVPEPGTVALRLIKTSRRLGSSVPVYESVTLSLYSFQVVLLNNQDTEINTIKPQ